MASVTRLLTSAVPVFRVDSNKGGPNNRSHEPTREAFRSERPKQFVPPGASAGYAAGKATPGGHVKHH